MGIRSATWLAFAAAFSLNCQQALDIPERDAALRLSCVDSRCECEAGWADCNGDLSSDGCETAVSNDPDNCGSCAHDCLGGLCEVGVCQPVQLTAALSTGLSPLLSVADDRLFYASREGIFALQFDATGHLAEGTNSEQIVALKDPIASLTHHGDMPIWADRRGIHSLNATLLPTPAGSSIVMVTALGDQLYYAQSAQTPPHLIARMPLTGGAGGSETLAQPAGSPLVFGSDGSQEAYWISAKSDGSDTSEFFHSAKPNVALDTWAGTESVFGNPRVALTADEIFYSRLGSGGYQLMRLGSSGTSPEADSRFAPLLSFDIHGSDIFFADNNGSVMRLPVAADDSTEVDILAASRDAPNNVTANSHAVFWFDTSRPDGMGVQAVLYMLAKPAAL